jgi:CheY-like chemotaxis protein
MSFALASTFRSGAGSAPDLTPGPAQETGRGPAPGTILMVDDDANDIFFLRRAFLKAGLSYPLLDLPDGEKAIEYFSGSNQYGDRIKFPLPVLLLLDLKMPKVTGYDVLEWLRKREELAQFKIVVLSSSGLESDIARAKQLGADDYRIKPGDIDETISLVKDITARWLDRPAPAAPPGGTSRQAPASPGTPKHEIC